MAHAGTKAPKIQQLEIRHGHTNTHVLVEFSRLVNYVTFTEEEVDAFIAAMKDSKERLARFKGKAH